MALVRKWLNNVLNNIALVLESKSNFSINMIMVQLSYEKLATSLMWSHIKVISLHIYPFI